MELFATPNLFEIYELCMLYEAQMLHVPEGGSPREEACVMLVGGEQGLSQGRPVQPPKEKLRGIEKECRWE
jgi:hypothetical protein